jgi:hypothetical protein
MLRLAGSPAGVFASLMIGADRVTAVLTDGWHEAAVEGQDRPPVVASRRVRMVEPGRLQPQEDGQDHHYGQGGVLPESAGAGEGSLIADEECRRAGITVCATFARLRN